MTKRKDLNPNRLDKIEKRLRDFMNAPDPDECAARGHQMSPSLELLAEAYLSGVDVENEARYASAYRQMTYCDVCSERFWVLVETPDTE